MNSVEELLKEKNITYKIQGQDFLIKCLNPEHEDNNPSLRIDKDTGIFNCFGCKFKGNIFSHFGLLTNNSSVKVAKLKRKLKDLVESLEGLALPEDAIPFTQSFRGISAKTLKRFGAFTTNSDDKLIDRIIFPIKDATDKTIVFLGRHTLSNANPKYQIYPSGVSIPTYPIKIPRGNTSIVLVEGIFDMLNCIDKGLDNVVCVFGTQTMKAETSRKLLYYKAQGIQKVYILFDGDKAGNDAAKELKPLIEESGFSVEIITLPDGVDPGELDEENVLSIKEYTR